MTTPAAVDRAVADPISLITDLVADAESELGSETIQDRGHRGRGRPREVTEPGQVPGDAPRRPDRWPVPGATGRRWLAALFDVSRPR
ncbi:hypothetical protein [Streptomyces sp. 891-h]|uniref:hypothetical protein n=1 Tax=Streptomyces sp. 891-h TaxID=2720714 RepID=UPI001FAA36F5|nr:hypothetical protein [Streptomyces sp. 891-h]UNZ21290.1 hypothetical protein HC362_33670 [Streptomyces sp. 891-h]